MGNNKLKLKLKLARVFPALLAMTKEPLVDCVFLLLGDVMREKSRRRVSNSSFPVCFLLGKLCRENRIEVRKAIQEVISSNRYFQRAYRHILD